MTVDTVPKCRWCKDTGFIDGSCWERWTCTECDIHRPPPVVKWELALMWASDSGGTGETEIIRHTAPCRIDRETDMLFATEDTSSPPIVCRKGWVWLRNYVNGHMVHDGIRFNHSGTNVVVRTTPGEHINIPPDKMKEILPP